MSKKYFLTAGLFWVCGVANAQVMLPAYQGVFSKKALTGTVASAPRSPVATSGIAEATISFSAPTSDGGNIIRGYTVTSSPGGFTASGAASPLTVTGLSNGTFYTFRVVATNALGNSVASTISASIAIFPIGTPYQGGKLAYIFEGLDYGYIEGETHGLIAATSDHGTKIKWNNGSFTWTGAASLFTGFSNTNTIITNQGATATSYAAGIARAYRGGGYTDWYLPSKEELNKLYLNKVAIGGFASFWYYSSTEINSTSAYAQYFLDGTSGTGGKEVPINVRAVRTF